MATYPPLRTGEDGVASIERADSWSDLLEGLRDKGDVVTAWEEVILRCEQVLFYSRHHWIEFLGRHYERQDLKAFVEGCAGKAPGDLDRESGNLIFLLYVLGCGGLGLEQVGPTLDTAALEELIERQTQLYTLAATGSQVGLSLVERSGRLPALRREVERSHYRYSVIDGGRWHRSERLIAREVVDLDQVPPSLQTLLGGSDDAEDRFRRLAEGCITAGETTEKVVIRIMRTALEDEWIAADHITLTAPRRLGEEHTADLHTRENVYRRTEMRSGLDLSGYEQQLGHASPERLKRVIAARMQVLKLKAANQFFGDGCMAGQAMDKSGDYMIFHNEDAHYPGHRNAGCSTGGRAPIPLSVESGGKRFTLPGIFADLRAVRLSHDPRHRFTEEGLKRLISYTRWIGVVLETVYAAGAILDIAGGASGCPHAPGGSKGEGQ